MHSCPYSAALPMMWLMLVAVSPSSAQPPLPKVPDEFQATIFAEPPKVNYPVCLTAAPTGEVFVGIDKQGSLGKKPGEGRIVRCIDTDGDGKADKINTFAEMDHPRGLIYDSGKLWVLHPPFLTLYHDDNRDGVADRKETLITGITTEYLTKRGADHTTNGIRMGIDGWIYIAIGDFGFVNAKGTDGRTLTMRGGGIVRVRPDGTEMEIFVRGLRNILDVCIDPRLNMFTRDNTNDGGGWDIRLSHIVQGAHYGYPSLFKNFSEEMMLPLADYGGGSGCGGMFVAEPSLPKRYQRALLTCDWGRNIVFFHPLEQAGATYRPKQETFVAISRPTDIDVDGSGRLYISSWHGGRFNYQGENVGYVAQLRPKDWKPVAFPDLSKLSDSDLLEQIKSDSYVRRFHTQREILRRGKKDSLVDGVKKLMEKGESLDTRVAAMFSYKQLAGSAAIPNLVSLLKDDQVREYALRALADRKSELKGVPTSSFVEALKDNNPRVRLAALVGLGRLGETSAAESILPLSVPPKEKTRKPRGFRTSVVKKKRSAKIDVDITGAKKLFLVVGDGGNGTGSDHADWLEPLLVGPKGNKKLTELKWTKAKAGWGGVYVDRNCRNMPLSYKGKPASFGIGTHSHSVIEYDLPPGFTRFTALGVLDDSCRGQGTVQFMVFVDELPSSFAPQFNPERTIPHIAQRVLIQLNAKQACLKALDRPHRRGALLALRWMHDKSVVDGLIARLGTRDAELRRALLKTLVRLYYREGEYKGGWWGTRPDTTGPYYKRAKWSQTDRIEETLRKELLKRSDSKTVNLMLTELNRHHVNLKDLPPDLAKLAKKRDFAPTIAVKVPTFDKNNPKQLGNIAFEKVLTHTLDAKGDVSVGKKLFARQSCAACHTVAKGQQPIGPSLVDIGKRYKRQQLIESIVKPSAQIAQGFATNVILTKEGKLYTGFIVREAADELELRTSEGKSHLVAKSLIEVRKNSKVSAMPDGLANNLTVEELASLIAYLQSIRSEE